MPVRSRLRLQRSSPILALAILCGAAAASADQYDQDLPVIQDIQFVGNERFDADALRKQMLLSFPSLKHPLRPRPRYRRNVFARELRRVEAFYQRQGFAGASARLDSVLADPGGRTVRLRVRVREGPQTILREVRFLPQPVVTLDELRRVSPFAPGDPYPFSPAMRGRATRAVRLAFLARGYLAVSVSDSIALSPDSTSARLFYHMDPGPQFTIRAVSITGNIQTQQELIRRELRFEAGEVYSYTRVQESQQNLYNTSLFRSVSFVEQKLDLENRTVDIAVRVLERRMAFVEGSVGFGRRDEFEARVSGAWGHRNLFGRGHALEARSTLAYNLEKKGDNYFAEQRLHYTQPHLFGSAARFSPQLSYVIDQRQDRVQLRRFRLDAQSSLQAGRYTTLAAGLSAAFTTTKLQEGGATDDLLETRALSLSMTRNSSDNLFDPRRGEQRALSVQRAGFGGENEFTRLTAAYDRYLPLGRSVLALGLRTGWVEAYGRSRAASAADIGIRGVPFEYLFQAGGGSTVRGFAENSLGAGLTVTRRDQDNVARVDTVGVQAGTVLAIANVELRTPLPLLSRWKLGMVLFVDSGNVWEDLQSMRHAVKDPHFDAPYLGLADLRYGYGFGLRYPTPFGPVRLDVGFPLKRHGRRHFHIGLGHTF